jgi:acyl carrier protein
VLLNQEEGWQDVLRAHLRTRLPDYMVPSLVIAIDQVPLTPNGKLNRSALPDPGQHWVSKEYIAPRTDYEQAIAVIWQDVMKRDRIGVDDHFFDIGGHSLLAVQIVARVKEQYAVEFSMRRLFEVATIAGMASYVENAVWLRESEAGTAADAGDDYEEIEI